MSHKQSYSSLMLVVFACQLRPQPTRRKLVRLCGLRPLTLAPPTYSQFAAPSHTGDIKESTISVYTPGMRESTLTIHYRFLSLCRLFLLFARAPLEM